MILELAALAVLTAPQEPVSEQLRAIHTDIDASDRVAAIEERLKKLGEGRVPGIRMPALGTRLRDAGLGAIDRVSREIAIAEEAEHVSAAFELTHGVRGRRGVSRDLPRNPDVKAFQTVCEHGYRDLHKALGSGRNLDEVAPWLHSAVESVRTSITNLSEIDADQEKLLRERMQRLERVEMDNILAIAEQISRTALLLGREEVIAALKREQERDPRADRGVGGKVLIDRDTAFGRFVVGSFGRNTYDVSQIDVLVDPGGNDEYRGPAGGAGELRRMAVVVDLDGDDVYEADNDALGSATFGIGVLVDLAGDDSYTALNRSAGYGSGGVGVFIDRAGKDTYRLGDQGAGLGFGGVGLLFDFAGDDDMEVGAQSCGVGLPGGVGLLIDTYGDDRRVARGEKKSLTQQAEEDVSIAFGAGVGVMPFLSGGVGAFLDISGNDRYEAKAVALGVGMRGGIGVFHDAAGNDAYDVTDVGLGASYASGMGLFVDRAGDDTYRAGSLSLGAAMDGGLATFLDRAGSDRYFAEGPTAGEAQRGALGSCIDLGGDDQWHLAGAPSGWRVYGIEPVDMPAVGVFLDGGTSKDQFDLSRMAPPLPDNDRTRLVRVGGEDSADVHVFVDR